MSFKVKGQGSKVKGLRASVARLSTFDFRLSTTRSRRQRGDTIIEVLLAMTVIGLILATSFGIANRATRTGRAAQERTEALKVAEAQIELTKAYLKDGANNIGTFTGSGNSFCIDVNATSAGNAAITSTDGRCNDTDGAGASGLYSIAVSESGGTYTVNVQWDRANTQDSTRGELSIFYRTGVL